MMEHAPDTCSECRYYNPNNQRCYGAPPHIEEGNGVVNVALRPLVDPDDIGCQIGTTARKDR